MSVSLSQLELLELRKQQQEMQQIVTEEQQRSQMESRREDTGFAEDSSQLYTIEEQTLVSTELMYADKMTIYDNIIPNLSCLVILSFLSVYGWYIRMLYPYVCVH